MKRLAMILKFKAGMKEQYITLHKHVWPEILTAIKEANISNNSTFVTDDHLVMYLEYTGDDFAKDWGTYGANPKVQEWFLQMKDLLEPYETPVPATKWTIMQEAFHLD